jgi:hypothetical protein
MTRVVTIAALGGSALLLAGCELGPKRSTQTGYRGAGLNQIIDPDTMAARPQAKAIRTSRWSPISARSGSTI